MIHNLLAFSALFFTFQLSAYAYDTVARIKSDIANYPRSHLKERTVLGQGTTVVIRGTNDDPTITLRYRTRETDPFEVELALRGRGALFVRGNKEGKEFIDFVVFQIRDWEKSLGRSILPKSGAGTSDSAAHAHLRLPKLATEIGSPYYVLEQATGAGNELAFAFFEIRPTDRNAMVSSASRLLLKHKGLKIATYGLAGFNITPEAIEPGTLFLLDVQGRLWKSKLAFDEKAGRYGQGELVQVSGEFTHLEREAEATIFAVRADNTITEFDASGMAIDRAKLGNETRVLDLHRSESGTLRLVTATNEILEPDFSSGSTKIVARLPESGSNAPTFAARALNDAVWYVRDHQLVRFDSTTGRMQRAELNPIFQSQQEDGREFQFVGADGNTLYVRAGTHLLAFRASALGPSLSYRILAESFFSQGLRPFGVNYGRFTQILPLQPRQADRGSTRRTDLLSGNPLTAKKNSECGQNLDPKSQ